MTSLYDPICEQVIHDAFVGLEARLIEAGPTLSQETLTWMRDYLAKGATLETPYKHPNSYPMLLFPWWMELSLHRDPDPQFQADLIRSTVCGYYAIRMVDNLMDGHATIELQLLPAMHFFLAEFQWIYQRYFPAEHPFWQFFLNTWYASADATLKDARVESLDLEHFMTVTAQKTSAVKIPLAAIAHRYGQVEALERWSRAQDLFGCWHQMYNDLFDWRKDLELKTKTYLLCEGERRRRPDEPVADWVMREGFLWSLSVLDGWMVELKAMARELGSEGFMAFLETRETLLNEKRAEIQRGLETANQLLSLLRQAKQGGTPG